MISFSQLIEMFAIGLFAYFVYLFKEALDLYKNSAYTDYKAYKKAISTGNRIKKPFRKQNEEPITQIHSNGTKVTVKDPNGISKTKDTLVDLRDLDPEIGMEFFEQEGNGL